MSRKKSGFHGPIALRMPQQRAEAARIGQPQHAQALRLLDDEIDMVVPSRRRGAAHVHAP